jgi:hypothetical protein
VFARTERFSGDRKAMQQMAALHALKLLPHFHQRMLAGDSN